MQMTKPYKKGNNVNFEPMTHDTNSVEQTWGPSGKQIPNHYLTSIISGTICYDMHGYKSKYSEIDDEDNDESRTELDTHANRPVVGRHALIIDYLNEEVQVPALTARMVDAAIRYECPYNGNEYILIIRNAIHIPFQLLKTESMVLMLNIYPKCGALIWIQQSEHWKSRHHIVNTYRFQNLRRIIPPMTEC
jgi:hypothetical protein